MQTGGARRGNATTSQHDERTRGQCNERTTRDDGATTSWRDKTTRGRRNERTARGNATTRGRLKERQRNNQPTRCVDKRVAL